MSVKTPLKSIEMLHPWDKGDLVADLRCDNRRLGCRAAS